jgi:hypothetical protein
LELPAEGLAVGLCAAFVGVGVGVVFIVGVGDGVVFTVGVTVGVVVGGACVGAGDGEGVGVVGVGEVGTGVLLTGEPCPTGGVGVEVGVAPGVDCFPCEVLVLAVVVFVLATSTMLTTASRLVATSRAIII